MGNYFYCNRFEHEIADCQVRIKDEIKGSQFVVGGSEAQGVGIIKNQEVHLGAEDLTR